jgi:hypothetical protein
MPFRKGSSYEEKECESLFNVYITKKEIKNYNPQGAKMLWVEASQIVCVPHVACFDSFLIQ